MSCSFLAAIIVACLGYMPDTAKRVTVPSKCVTNLSPANQVKAKACAAENGVKFRIVWKRKRART